MVEERATLQSDIDLLAMEGRDDGFNLAPIETARLLLMGQDTSLCCTSYVADGELIAISGLYTPSLLGDEAHVWMVASLAVKRHKIAFLRHAMKTIDSLPYGRVTCFCDPDFVETRNWLRRLRFEWISDVDIAGRLFMVLRRIR